MSISKASNSFASRGCRRKQVQLALSRTQPVDLIPMCTSGHVPTCSPVLLWGCAVFNARLRRGAACRQSRQRLQRAPSRCLGCSRGRLCVCRRSGAVEGFLNDGWDGLDLGAQLLLDAEEVEAVLVSD